MSNLAWNGDNEGSLVERAQAGDLEAFDLLVSHFRTAAIILARSILSSTDLADDAVQDSFLSAYKSLPQLQNANQFAAWLGSIVRHRSRRIAKGEKRANLPLDDLILAYSPSMTVQMDQHWTNEELHGSISELPEEIRSPIHLYYLEDWSVQSISDFLGLTESTVKWRLHSGRCHLRRVLSK